MLNYNKIEVRPLSGLRSEVGQFLSKYRPGTDKIGLIRSITREMIDGGRVFKHAVSKRPDVMKNSTITVNNYNQNLTS